MKDHVNQEGDSVEQAIVSLPLPPGWVRTIIADIAEVRLGRQRSPRNRSQKHPTKYIRAANITWQGLDLSDVLDMEFNASELAAYRLMPGDVLLSEASGSASQVGKPALWSGEVDDCCFQNTVIRYRSRATVPRFANLVFLHFARNGVFARVAKGVGIHHLSADRFSRLPFLLPPLNEQRRIVAKLDELLSDLDAGVAALERVKANLKRYRAAVLKAAVEGRLTEEWRAKNRPQETGAQLLKRILHDRRRRWEEEQLAAFAAAGKEPTKNWRSRYKEPVAPDTSNLPPLPDGWRWVSLDQLLTYLRNGYFQSPSGADRGTPILRINAVRAMAVDLDEVRYLDRVEGDVNTFYVDDGDLLFTRYNGSIDLLGVAGMVRGCMRPVLHPDKLIRVKLAAGQPLASFVEIAANVGASRAHMVGRARTTAGQTGISGQDIREMPIPLPPMSEQSEIVAEAWERLSQIDAAEIEIEHGLARAANLRQSILKRAFAGKLVAQDPADEPAAVLLARIEQSRAAATAVRTNAKPHSDEFLRRAAIVSYTVKRLAAQPSFGRTQLEKTLHLAQSHLGIDLGLQFERYAAGPFDKSIYRLEGTANKSGWFTKKNRPRVGVTYHPGPKIDSMCQHAARLLGDKQADFDRLLDHIAGMNTDEAELFSTAYAAWNDLLIDGRDADDGAIIKEIHGWHASKKKFTRTAILNRLRWMRRNGYIPRGKGQKTKPMPIAANSRRGGRR